MLFLENLKIPSRERENNKYCPLGGLSNNDSINDLNFYNMKTNDNAGDCPVCRNATKQDEKQVYCDNCGFNIQNRDNNPKIPEKTTDEL